MKQMTFADAEYAGKRKQTRKELFLIEIDRVVLLKGLIPLIEAHYPKGEGRRPVFPLMTMLQVTRFCMSSHSPSVLPTEYNQLICESHHNSASAPYRLFWLGHTRLPAFTLCYQPARTTRRTP